MKVNSGQAPSTLIPEYIGSDFDKVITVADNMETVTEVVANLDHIKTVESKLGDITTVAGNITDVVTVADNIDYVKDVAEGIEGLPVTSYIGDEPPTQPLNGAEWYCTTDGRTYVWYTDDDSGQWVESSPQSIVETVVSYIGDKPPTKPLNGAEWYCTTDGRSYVWYADADSGQWVESSPQSAFPASTGKMTLNAAATDAETTTALVNQIRAELIAKGLAQ